jgi:hypothetical protein
MLGVVLNGPIDVFETAHDSLAATWESLPSPLRWLASVLEVNAYGYREVPWTYDQGYCATALAWQDCWRPVTASFRMGGYFVPFVLGLLAFFGWWLAAHPGRDRRIVGAALIGTTILAALLPRSHELRYYMFWMIVLVALCLVAVFNQAERPSRGAASAVLGTIILIALASVLSMTQGRYVAPMALSVDALAKRSAIGEKVAAIPDGAAVCVDPGWQPFTFLFAPVFHPGRSYAVLDGTIGACDRVMPPPAKPQASSGL